MNLFPIIQPETVAQVETSLPMCREVAWNFEADEPIWQNGEPVIVEGMDAVLVWAWNALHTERFRYEIYSWQYGNETEALIGQSFSGDLKRAEAMRYTSECLLVSPYITDVKDMTVTFENDRLKIGGTIVTVYGEMKINV